MQHAAITYRNENNNSFNDLYRAMDLQKENFDHTESASRFFGFNTDINSKSDWEFFCNELEYE